MRTITNGLACILVVAMLVLSPLVWAFPGPGPTLKAGHKYNLPLQGVIQQVGEDPAYDPGNKLMDLTLGRTDKGNLMLVFEWTHDPGADVRPDRYVLALLFDFDDDGTWEDSDKFTNTIDDSLILLTLGYDMDVWIGKPTKPHEKWIAFFLPRGLYVYSWNGTDKEPGTPRGWDIGTPIGGPPAQGPGPISGEMWKGVPGPGPLYPDGSSVDFTPFYTTFSGNSYRAEIPVPLDLFHSVSGFGFGLSQQTAVSDQQPWLMWIWPSQGAPVTDVLGALGAENGAEYLGELDPDAEGPWNYVLQDPPGPRPVGGFATAVDKIVLVAPWIVLVAIAGVALVVALMARKRKV